MTPGESRPRERDRQRAAELPASEEAGAGSSAGAPGFVPLSSVADATQRQSWRSLEELAGAPEYRQSLEREFAIQAPRDMEPLSRREFFRVMGATLALAGASGCAYQPAERILPYVEQPESIVPGRPLFFATAFQKGGYSIGVLAESHMGRPTKLEGNPQHPASLGATDAITQASLLTLYDPDRSQAVRHLGDITTWDLFIGAIAEKMEALRSRRGAGLRILSESFTSPTLAAQMRRLFRLHPEAKIHVYDPVGRENVREGARLAFGSEANPVYHFDRAERILSLDANFLADEPGSVRYAREFADGRRVRAATKKMGRLYVVESAPTITGASADHRLPLKPSEIESFARAVAATLGISGASGEVPARVPRNWVPALVRDLRAHPGRSLVVAGPQQPPAVHALAHAMNAALGNLGKTVTFTASLEPNFGPRQGSLPELVADIHAGRVDTLIVLDSNPVYSAPVDLDFRGAMEKVPLRVHLGLYDDETAVLCHWHVPQSHYLEAWSDGRAFDGTANIVQPLIQPLYATRSAHELLAVLMAEENKQGYDIVRETWRARAGGAAFERRWHQAVRDGLVAGSAAAEKPVAMRSDFAARVPPPPAPESGALEIAFRPDPSLWDGRYANNGWLQELPKPLSTLTWDNAALMSPATARGHGLGKDDVIEILAGKQRLSLPVWVMPGHPDDAITIYLGGGRRRAGKIGTGAGFNAYALRSTATPWILRGANVRLTGNRSRLANTQNHFLMLGRHLAREGTLAQFAANPQPEFMHLEDQNEVPSLYTAEWPSDQLPGPGGGLGARGVGAYRGTGYNNEQIPAWGMAIDLNACIGCNACTLACQAENNIPTVGKDQVLNHREMHWIRIDTYYSSANDRTPDANPDTLFQPVPCQHCEKAPCEPVCPVEATSHSAEGINEMTYNRCIGTRYCSNNCPYKVRRFNYLQYSQQQSPTITLLANPDVTVRSRGVMEKCTYCIQRINEARIQAEREERPIRDGDLVTACQQVCPTQAIIFGNINDAESNGGRGSRVRQLKLEPLNYTVLSELGTRPRTSYLAKLRNPNEALAQQGVD